MTEIGDKLFIDLSGETKEECLESINKERKKLCKLLAQAYNESNMPKVADLIKVIARVESIAESIAELTDEEDNE